MQTIQKIIRAVCSYLDKNEIEYSLVGGATLPLLGMPRSTFDVDVIARIDESGAAGFAKYLKTKGFLASEKDIIAALREKSHCTIDFKEPPYRIDLKGIYGESEEWTVKRSKELEYLGMRVRVQSPEDAIAGKLFFGGEQQLEDALAIYVRQLPALDLGYLEGACKRLGVNNRLKGIISKAKKYS